MHKKYLATILALSQILIVSCGSTQATNDAQPTTSSQSSSTASSTSSSTASSSTTTQQEVKEVKVLENGEIHVFSGEFNFPTTKDESTVPEHTNSINAAITAAQAGNTIIIHEGVYRETVNLRNKDDLTIKSFEDDYVLITGTEIVTGFTEATDHPNAGVYVADAHTLGLGMKYTQVFANGNMGNIARYPNYTIDDMMLPIEDGGGYSLLSSVYKNAGTPDAYATFEDGELPDVDLTGGIFRGLVGKNREYPIGTVVANDGNTITFHDTVTSVWATNQSVAQTYHKFGFGFVMHKNLIDIPNEWYHDSGKLYYMPEQNQSMDTLNIEMQTRDKVLTISNCSNLTLENIHFHAGSAEITSINTLKIEGCSFRYMSPFLIPSSYGNNGTMSTGIKMTMANDVHFNNTYVGHTWGNGVAVVSGSGNSFTNCVFEDIGWIGTFSSSILTTAQDNFIQYCTFKDNGRFQIRVNSNDLKIDILDSVFVGAMKMGEDAGPLEFTSTGQIAPLDLMGSEIAYNIIHDLGGIPVSSGGYLRQYTKAFYMEDVNNYTVHHNLTYNITAKDSVDYPGIQLYGGYLYLGPRYNDMELPVNFYNNTSYNCTSNIAVWHIRINNFEELQAQGLQQTGNGGSLRDGDFKNNLYNEGEFSLGYYNQNISMTGGNQTNIDYPDKVALSIVTDNFEEFNEHGKQIDYNFNQSHNMIVSESEAASYYVDVESNNFALAENSPAKGAGTPIDGITEAGVANPDLGALEGSDRVLHAGSTLEIPTFKEIISLT